MPFSQPASRSCQHPHGNIAVHMVKGGFLPMLLYRYAECICNIVRIISFAGIYFRLLSTWLVTGSKVLFIVRFLFPLFLKKYLWNIQVKNIKCFPFKLDPISRILYRQPLPTPFHGRPALRTRDLVLLLRLSGFATHQRSASLSFSSHPSTTMRFNSLLNIIWI